MDYIQQLHTVPYTVIAALVSATAVRITSYIRTTKIAFPFDTKSVEQVQIAIECVPRVAEHGFGVAKGTLHTTEKDVALAFVRTRDGSTTTFSGEPHVFPRQHI